MRLRLVFHLLVLLVVLLVLRVLRVLLLVLLHAVSWVLLEEWNRLDFNLAAYVDSGGVSGAANASVPLRMPKARANRLHMMPTFGSFSHLPT